MRNGILVRLIALAWCLLIGMTAISLGIGSAFPRMNTIAQPLVCAGGAMTYQTTTTRYRPGETYTQSSYACVDPSGGTTRIGPLAIAFSAGIFYGLLLYAFFELFWGVGRRLFTVDEPRSRPGRSSPDAMAPSGAAPTAQSTLSEVDLLALRALLANGRRIDAVKLYRTLTRAGLKEAAEAVDRLG